MKRVWRLGSGCWGDSSVVQRTNQAADEFARLNAKLLEIGLFDHGYKFVVEQHITHGADFAARSAGYVIRLPFFRNVEAFPTFGNIVHHGNSRSLKLVTQAEVSCQRFP